MGKSERIRSSDIATLIGLANELHELPANTIVRHEHALKVLLKLIGAAVGFSCLFRTRDAEALDLLMLIYEGWHTDPQREAANHYFRTLTPPNPARRIMIRRARAARDGPIAATRDAVVPDRAWYASDYVQLHQRAMGADHQVFSVMAMDGSDVFTSLAFSRLWGERRRFGARERDLLRLFHSQSGWMYRVAPTMPHSEAAPAALALSPRQEDTLRLLLHGDGEKQIAVQLNLSRHTVHEHVKAIYRITGVNSRGELLAKLLAK